jgi:hypothetical protein
LLHHFGAHLPGEDTAPHLSDEDWRAGGALAIRIKVLASHVRNLIKRPRNRLFAVDKKRHRSRWGSGRSRLQQGAPRNSVWLCFSGHREVTQTYSVRSTMVERRRSAARLVIARTQIFHLFN